MEPVEEKSPIEQPHREDAGIPDPYCTEQEDLTEEDWQQINIQSPREDAGIPDPHCTNQEPLTKEDWDGLAYTSPKIRENWIRIPQVLFNKTFILAVGALGCVFSLFIATQILIFLDLVANAPVWVQAPLYILVFVLTGIVLSAGIRLITLYARLSQNPKISLKGLRNLSALKKSRREVQKNMTIAREQLLSYVSDYPIHDVVYDYDELKKLGFTQENLDKLNKHKNRLVRRDVAPSDKEWLDDFQERFLSILNETVDGRIRYYMLRVGLKTAVIPSTLIDTLIVVYCSFAMIGDICKIYNLKMDTLSTAVILGRVFVHGYIAGELEELSTSIAEEVADKITQGVSKKFFDIFAPKTAEGAANALLLWRLGSAARKLLQPLDV